MSESDIEVGRFGDEERETLQFVGSQKDVTSLVPVDNAFDGSVTSFLLDWKKDQMKFVVENSLGKKEHIYEGDVLVPNEHRLHINLWYYQTDGPTQPAPGASVTLRSIEQTPDEEGL